jgi:hypothetical protein
VGSGPLSPSHGLTANRPPQARLEEEPERMNCPTCFGIGEVLIDKDGQPVSRLRDAATMITCPECGGCGKIHCCEGERAQPEPEEQ